MSVEEEPAPDGRSTPRKIAPNTTGRQRRRMRTSGASAVIFGFSQDERATRVVAPLDSNGATKAISDEIATHVRTHPVHTLTIDIALDAAFGSAVCGGAIARRGATLRYKEKYYDTRRSTTLRYAAHFLSFT